MHCFNTVLPESENVLFSPASVQEVYAFVTTMHQHLRIHNTKSVVACLPQDDSARQITLLAQLMGCFMVLDLGAGFEAVVQGFKPIAHLFVCFRDDAETLHKSCTVQDCVLEPLDRPYERNQACGRTPLLGIFQH